MKNNKIIISGPPGSGKTQIIKRLSEKGYSTNKEIHPGEITNKTDKLKLSSILFNQRINQYHSTESLSSTSLEKPLNELLFFDRSIIDVVAYMNFWNKEYPLEWDNKILKYRYSKNIFYTPNWKEIYQKTNQRHETYEEAKTIDVFLRQSFKKFNYNIIEVPKLNINDRVSFILQNI